MPAAPYRSGRDRAALRSRPAADTRPRTVAEIPAGLIPCAASHSSILGRFPGRSLLFATINP